MNSPDITMEEYESLVIPELEAARSSVCRRSWTAHECAVLTKYFEQMDVPVEAIAKHLDRTLASVRNKAEEMGLKRV